MTDGSTFLLAKFAPPPLRPDWVQRQQLLERLDANIARRLVLVSTPAGFGKTTLLSSWYATHAHRSETDRDEVFAWLSLEPADNDPARFWRYVLRALQLAYERNADHPVVALNLSPLASTETFLTALLNAFTVPRYSPTASVLSRNTVLILDDYHVISNQAIDRALEFLLEHLPPSLHLVIASRTSPPLALAKLRASGQIAELDAEDVLFSAEEMARYLSSTLPLSFSEEQLARLQRQTHGWVVPLHLAALAWHGGNDAESFVASLRGDHPAIVDYLASEVFDQQPVQVQRFLLASSVLSQCAAPLCDAVLQRTDSDRMLRLLERARLFLIPLDATHRWYRYHPIFADFLQDRVLQTFPDDMAIWRQRAADWYLRHEEPVERAASLALPHLMATHDWERVADLIEAVAERMLWRSGEISTLLHWVQQIPRDLIHRRPRLAAALAWALTLTGEFDAAETAVQTAESLLIADDKMTTVPQDEISYRQLLGDALAIRARIAVYHDVERASTLSEQALKLLPAEAHLLQADLLLNIGYAQLRAHNYIAAGRAFQAARRIGRRYGNARADMLASRYLASSYMMRGLLNDAATVYRQALRRALTSDQEPPPAVGILYVGSALLLYERNEIDAALDHAQQGLDLGRRSGEMKTLFPAYLALAQIHIGSGDVAQAALALNDAERLADLQLFPWADEDIAAGRARLHIAQGEIGLAARELSRNGWRLTGEQSIPFSVCPFIIQLGWARVMLAQQRFETAVSLLRGVLDRVRREQPQSSALPILVLYALALAAHGDGEQACTLLAHALPSATAHGYTRTFVDEGAPMAALLRQIMLTGAAPGAADLLRAFAPEQRHGAVSNNGASQSAAQLSAREVEVIRLMAAGHSNQQIADDLVIALSTVRTHTKHIYRKLGVQGRVRAVARATALQVL